MAAENLDYLIDRYATIGPSTCLSEQTWAVDIADLLETNPNIESQKLVKVLRMPVRGIRNESLVNNTTLRLNDDTHVLQSLMRGNDRAVSLYDRIGNLYDASMQAVGGNYHLKVKGGMVWTNLLYHSSISTEHDLAVWVFKERHPHNGSLRMIITRS